jgi:hypothetical protein
MLEPQSILRDAGGGFPATTLAPLLAHPPLQSEPSPATVGSPEITDEEINAATAACCRICLECESEPGEPPPQLADGVPYPFLLVCAKWQRDRRSVQLQHMVQLVGLP